MGRTVGRAVGHAVGRAVDCTVGRAAGYALCGATAQCRAPPGRRQRVST